MHEHTRPPVGKARSARLPPAVYVLAAGVFLMGTTEFVVAGLLADIAADMGVGLARAGLTITVFAIGMIVGALLMALATLRMPQRLTLTLALGVFALGHVAAVSGAPSPPRPPSCPEPPTDPVST